MQSLIPVAIICLRASYRRVLVLYNITLLELETLLESLSFYDLFGIFKKYRNIIFAQTSNDQFL